jgi:cell division transport system permease protein
MNQPIAGGQAAKQPKKSNKLSGAHSTQSTTSSRFQHWLDHHRREAGDSFGRLARVPLSTLMTVTVMTIALSLPLALGQLLHDTRQAVATWDADARLSVYLTEGTDAVAQRVVLAQAQALSGVSRAHLITPEAALEEFKAKSNYGPALEQLGSNPLPAVLEVFPKDTSNTDAMTALRDQFAQWPEVALAEVDIAWVQRLRTALDIGDRLLLAIAGTLILGGLLVVGNTIRLSIESRRDEIRVISLLGGTHGFVRRPFVYMGLWCGLSAGVFTLAMVSGLIAWLSEPVLSLARLYGSQFTLSYPSLQTSTGVILGASALGLIGAWIAVDRHLRELEP